MIVTQTISFAFYRCQNSGTENFRDLPREEQLRAGSFGARNLALPSGPPGLACSVGWGRLGLGAGDALARSWELRDGGGARIRSSTESLRSSLIRKEGQGWGADGVGGACRAITTNGGEVRRPELLRLWRSHHYPPRLRVSAARCEPLGQGPRCPSRAGHLVVRRQTSAPLKAGGGGVGGNSLSQGAVSVATASSASL